MFKINIFFYGYKSSFRFFFRGVGKKKIFINHKIFFLPFLLLVPIFRFGGFLPKSIFFNRLISRLERYRLLYKIRFLAFFFALHKNGKKLKAELLMISIILLIRSKLKCRHPFAIINISFDILEPYYYLRRFRRSGRVFLIPAPVVKRKRSFFAIGFLIKSIEIQRKVSSDNLCELFSNEIILLFNRRTRNNCQSLKMKRDFIMEVFSRRFSCRFLRINVGKIIF